MTERNVLFGELFWLGTFWPIHAVFVAGEQLCVLGLVLFWLIQAVFVIKELFCGVGTPS